jgi:pyrimidine operon attenuation protein/uracil phosphoribosyltransferase
MAAGKNKLKARILDSTSMQRALNRIAHEILEHNPNVRDLVLVGIGCRGVPLAHRLAQIIKQTEGESVCLGSLQADGKRIPCDLTQKTVILVDDLLYTGRTARAALDALSDFGKPRIVQLAVLIDRGHRELPIHADYVGKNVPTASNEIVDVRIKEIDHEEHVVILE